MVKLRAIGGIVALALSASTVAAQQPQASPDMPRSPAMAAEGKMSMMRMDSPNHRLDSLVDRMNRTSGNQKTQAMAAVINELVAQRKAMQGRMQQMMEGEGMMGMMKDSMATSAKPTVEGSAVPADTADHSAHHPPQ